MTATQTLPGGTRKYSPAALHKGVVSSFHTLTIKLIPFQLPLRTRTASRTGTQLIEIIQI